MNITKLKYYSTEKLEGILDELENGDGGRGMKDLQLADFIANIRNSYHTSSTRTGRYCIDGATRSATMLTIQGTNGYIKRHNSAEAYRSNYDIVDWILNHI